MRLDKHLLEDGLHIYEYKGVLNTYEEFLEFKNAFEQILEVTKEEVKDKIPNIPHGTYEPKHEFKKIIQAPYATIRLYFDAHHISLYTLGYLLSINDAQNISIELIVSNFRLFYALEEMDLIETFKVKIKEEI